MTSSDSTSASRATARPSSSTSDLFGGVYARGPVTAEVDDRAWLQAMLDVEAALARSGERLGTLTAEQADAVEAACRAEDYDIEALGRETAQHATPVVGLVRELRARAGDHAHEGATSQDVVDTALMLIASRALRLIES